MLCSRTSGSDTIRSAIAHFFTLFPTPTDVLEADDDTIKEVIHPLGLQPTRLAAVRAVARDFLATDWQEPAQFKGCGKFVTDSWRIFCKGSRETKGNKPQLLELVKISCQSLGHSTTTCTMLLGEVITLVN